MIRRASHLQDTRLSTKTIGLKVISSAQNSERGVHSLTYFFHPLTRRLVILLDCLSKPMDELSISLIDPLDETNRSTRIPLF